MPDLRQDEFGEQGGMVPLGAGYVCGVRVPVKGGSPRRFSVYRDGGHYWAHEGDVHLGAEVRPGVILRGVLVTKADGAVRRFPVAER